MKILHVEPNDVYAIVQINGGILAIIIGFISAYALYVYSKVQELELQIIQEASKINLNPIYLPKIQIDHSALDSSKEEKRYHLSERLRHISLGIPNRISVEKSILKQIPNFAQDLGPKLTDEQIGYEIILILSAIFSNYPFVSISGDYQPDQRLIRFNNLADIQKWVKEMNTLLYFLIWCLSVNRPNLEWDIDKYFANPPFGMLRLGGRFDLNAYYMAAMQTKELVRSVNSLLEQAEARKPDAGRILTGVILSFLGIITGVIFPLINKQTPAEVFVIFPTLCYSAIFIYIIYFLFKK